ncbi:hypothetical protein D3C73_577650 [compost metagenome]
MDLLKRGVVVMKKFIFVVNGNVVEVDGKNVFDEEKIKGLIVEMGGGKDDEFGVSGSGEGEDISLEELWKLMVEGGKVELIDGELCDKGDDWVEFELFEVKM